MDSWLVLRLRRAETSWPSLMAGALEQLVDKDLPGYAVRVVTTSSLRCARERIEREAVPLCSARSGTSAGHSIFLRVDRVVQSGVG
jgi:hypothetical protein